MSCKWGDPLQNAQTYFRCEPAFASLRRTRSLMVSKVLPL